MTSDRQPPEYETRSVRAISARMRALRRATSPNQAAFCRRVGLAPNAWNQYETGRGRPSLDQALQLHDALGVSLDWIYLGNAAGLPYGLAGDILAQMDAERDAQRAEPHPVGRGPRPREEGERE